MKFILFILIGVAAGYLAGKVMKGKGFGLVLNLILGVVGSFVGGLIFGVLRIAVGGSFIGSLITAFVGAALLIFIGNILHGKK